MSISDSFDSFAKANEGITPSSFMSINWMQNVELHVPLYQRLFVWEEEQMNQLLNDLKQAFQTKTPYYIGTLTVYRDPRPEKQYTWQLVDGQQRITVLTLLGIACSFKWNHNCLWKPFLMKQDGHDSRLQYYARDSDKHDLNTLIRSTLTTGAAKTSLVEVLANEIKNANMKLFFEVFERFVSLHTPSPAFSEFVYTKTIALVSFLPDSYETDDLNLYFEKMNSGGKQLEAHEILKARSFGKHSVKWNLIANGSARFKNPPEAEGEGAMKEELSLETFLAQETYKYNRETDDPPFKPDDHIRLVMSFPVFLLHSLSICIGADDENAIGNVFWDPKQLLSTFQKAAKEWSQKKNHNEATKYFCDAFVEVMENYRKWIDKFIIHIEDSRPMSPYQQVDGSADRYTVNPAYEKPVWQFQSMLYVSSDERQHWVLDAYQYFAQNQLGEKDEEGFLSMLKQRDAKQHMFIDDPAKLSYPSIERYWFWRLDYILWEMRGSLSLERDQKDAVDVYTFRRNRSIEHLYPQSNDENWEPKELNSFGNLAMISASFNSQQSNHGVAEKFGRLKDKMVNKDLESIKLLLMFIAAESHNQWKRKEASEHSRKMREVLKHYCDSVHPA